jgi:hypothetical protein
MAAMAMAVRPGRMMPILIAVLGDDPRKGAKMASALNHMEAVAWTEKMAP